MRSLRDERFLQVYDISCDLCEKLIGTERPNAMGTPTNNLSDGVITITTGVNDIDICPSCRYSGAMPKGAMSTLKLVKEQLKQTKITGCVLDVVLCIDKLSSVIFILEQLGY